MFEKLIVLLSGAVDKIVIIVCMLGMIYCCYCVHDDFYILEKSSGKDILKYKPTVSGGEENLGFEELLKINEDVIAWLTIDDTNIDYPVVKGEDNKEYINLDVFRNYSLGGVPFIDFRNSSDFSDYFTIFYGHHMDMGIMFGGLDEFLNEDYLRSHDHGLLITKDISYDIYFFASGKTSGYDGILFNPFDMEGERVETLWSRIKEVMIIRLKEINVDEGNLVMLSTCSTPESYDRIVLFGYLTKKLT